MARLDGKLLVRDLLVGSAAGYGATMAMEYFNTFAFSHIESQSARHREEDTRAAMPTVVLVRRVTNVSGVV